MGVETSEFYQCAFCQCAPILRDGQKKADPPPVEKKVGKNIPENAHKRPLCAFFSLIFATHSIPSNTKMFFFCVAAAIIFVVVVLLYVCMLKINEFIYAFCVVFLFSLSIFCDYIIMTIF